MISDAPLPHAPALEDGIELRLVFTLAGQLLAVPVERLRELSEPLPTAFLPLVPPWFRGLANLRGEVLAVLDLLPFLGWGELPERPSNRLLVLGPPPPADAVAGLLVERVLGVTAVARESLRRTAEPPPQALPLAPYLEGWFTGEVSGDFPGQQGEIGVLAVERLLEAMRKETT